MHGAVYAPNKIVIYIERVRYIAWGCRLWGLLAEMIDAIKFYCLVGCRHIDISEMYKYYCENWIVICARIKSYCIANEIVKIYEPKRRRWKIIRSVLIFSSYDRIFMLYAHEILKWIKMEYNILILPSFDLYWWIKLMTCWEVGETHF